MATTDVFNSVDKFVLVDVETAYGVGAAADLDENDLFYVEDFEPDMEINIVDRIPLSGQRPGMTGVTTKQVGIVKFTTELAPQTITADSTVVPFCHPVLVSTGWAATHDAGATTYTYTLQDYGHSSMELEAYEWDEDHSHVWQWDYLGVRGNGVIKWTVADRALIEFDGKGVSIGRSLVASGSVPDITAGSGFHDELPIVHEAATVTLTEQSGSTTYDGCLLDMELRPNFRVEEQMCADATGAVTRIYLTPDGHAELDITVETVADSDFDPYTVWENNTKVRVQVTWTDLGGTGDTVALDCYVYITNITKENDREGRQALTLNCKMVWSGLVPSGICTLVWDTP